MKALLAVALLTAARGAAAAMPVWFPESPCHGQTASDLAPPGGVAIARVHLRGNEAPHDVAMKRDASGLWWVPLPEWQRWTSRAAGTPVHDAAGVAWVPVKASRDLAYRVDACTAEIWIEANAQQDERIGFGNGRTEVTPASFGGFANLEAHYGGFLGRGRISGLLDVAVFDAIGSARSGFLLTPQTARRLDTSVIHDDVASAMRLRLGDSISRPAEWEPAVRYGGVQWGTDYSLQPTRITYPLPTFRGSAALPSTVELYANGNRIAQSEVGSGSYQLIGVPTLSGAGDLTVRVRDPLGHETRYSVPFYSSPRLLAEGLWVHTWEAGFLREAYAQDQDRYTRGFAAASLREGFSDTLTANLRVEASGRGGLLGFGTDYRLGQVGIVSAALAASADGARSGALLSLGFEHIGPRFGISLRRRLASAAYSDLGRSAGTLHFSDSARVSINTGLGGSFSAVYASERPWQQPAVQFVGLACTQRLARWADLYASALHSLNRDQGNSGDSIQIGLTFLLGTRTSANVQWAEDGGESVRRYAAQISPPGPLGGALQADYDDSANGVRVLDGQWSGARGSIGAGLEGMGRRVEPAAMIRTGLAVLDGHAYWTRPIDTSFVVVDAGAANVRIYRDNLEVGRSDAGGRLLVPDLRPFDRNHLGIDDRDLPITLGLASSEETIAPPSGAGVSLRFALDQAAPSRLILRDDHGHVIPAGAALTLDDQQLPLPVGRAGLVYAAIGPHARRLQARWTGHRCLADLRHSGSTVVAGTCREIAP